MQRHCICMVPSQDSQWYYQHDIETPAHHQPIMYSSHIQFTVLQKYYMVCQVHYTVNILNASIIQNLSTVQRLFALLTMTRSGGYWANFRSITKKKPGLKHRLLIGYDVHIWQVSPQLSCGDTCEYACNV